MTTPILFNVLDDHVILRSSNGIYRQAKVAIRKGYLYASIGSSFVMLYANGTTSSPTTRWEDIEASLVFEPGSFGRLQVRP